MHKLWYIIFLFINILQISLESKKLILIQSVWRHGERIPTATYPNDPINQENWNLPFGSLTKKGILQHVIQGKKLRKRYIDELNFINKKYIPHEVEARSTIVDRCLQSAYANFCGLYSNDNKTILNDDDNLSCNLMFVPIKTDYFGSDKVWEEGKNCNVLKKLREQRMRMVVPHLEEKYKTFLEYISFHSGIPNMTIVDMVHLHNIISVQKHLNITQKSWLTKETFSQMQNLSSLLNSFYDGEEGFNVDRDKRIIRLHGGPLFKFIFDNFEKRILFKSSPTLYTNNNTYFKLNDFKHKLYFSFSAHDLNIFSILRLLGATNIIFRDSLFPDFSTMLVFELWQRDIFNYDIALLYSKNDKSELENVTRYIKGCGGGDYCKFDILKILIKDLLPTNVEKECSIE
uniref:acid phosphatase n=1 Tax=Parastrongyloides trichosuri TaxID=131310 RepID=A0A0N4ZTF2_PARTI